MKGIGESAPDFPAHMNELGKFVFLRTYSRFLPQEGRRETWKETVLRVTQYNVGLAVLHMHAQGINYDESELREEAELMFDNVFNLRQFPSGRSLWVGGADGGVADKFPLSNFNCSFTNLEKLVDFGDAFYLLLIGSGVGAKATKKMASKVPAMRLDLKVTHAPYTRRYPLVKVEDTEVYIVEEGRKAVMHVGDSKEGWVKALREFLRLHHEAQFVDLKEVVIYYDYVRPKGTRLKTFGGTASGHEPLMEMFEGIDSVLKGTIDPYTTGPDPLTDCTEGPLYGNMRPIHMLDILNLIGSNVVAGGVRRTAQIFLFDADDYESMMAKYGINGIWDDYDSQGNIIKTAEQKHGEVLQAFRNAGQEWVAERFEKMPLRDENARALPHRAMSNNSVAFTEKPEKNVVNLIFSLMRNEGEPGFINLEAAAIRRLNAQGIMFPSRELVDKTMAAIGLNPCAEILLHTKGVCNLTTVNMMAFVIHDENGNLVLDMPAMIQAQRLSTRIGLRMTLPQMELEEWNATQERDRLLGVSLTGVQDAFAVLGLPVDTQNFVLRLMSDAARDEADKYAKRMRVSSPLLDTTVKPEGTLSQVAGGVSSGLHFSHAPYYIRRIRISSQDPMARALIAMGFRLLAEVGTKNPQTGKVFEVAALSSPEALEAARTFVVEFPIASGASKTKDDVHVDEQFDVYFRFQQYYTRHNSSITVHVRPDEWERAADRIYDEWYDFVGVSFLSYDGGSYALAPYETITEEQYNSMISEFPAFEIDILREYDTQGDGDLEGLEGCEGGACPIR